MNIPNRCDECKHVEGSVSGNEGLCRLLADKHSKNDQFLATVFYDERHPMCPLPPVRKVDKD